ncbi:MAG: hypothetical protein BMS9Abin23_0526 [Thermodesulfobacteriota bacterium]|nr:MAG: hypothetical protein BMS9Abin23_0526 [Thermodesulfobacteriota bacterium]
MRFLPETGGGFLFAAMFVYLGAVMSFPGPTSAADIVLDRASIECISCHEADVTAESVHVVGGPGHDHPVGVDYVGLAARVPALVKPSELDPALRLVSGRISCVTCHVPYDKKNHLTLAAKRKEMPAIPDPMLNVDNSGSGLCMSCHLK